MALDGARLLYRIRDQSIAHTVLAQVPAVTFQVGSVIAPEVLLKCLADNFLVLGSRRATAGQRASNAMMSTWFTTYIYRCRRSVRMVARAYLVARPRAQNTPAHVPAQSARYPIFTVAICFPALCAAKEPL